MTGPEITGTEKTGLSWVHEPDPRWDAEKQRTIGSAPSGALDLDHAEGASLPGDWWAVRTPAGDVVGHGWLDATWGGDAEILLAVDASVQAQGIGSFVLDRLEREAASRGMNYVYNTVRETHPQRDEVHDWLVARGYRGSSSDTTLRKRVAADSQREAPEHHPTRARPGPSRPATGRGETSPDEGGRGAGGEESGGYVDVEDHRF